MVLVNNCYKYFKTTVYLNHSYNLDMILPVSEKEIRKSQVIIHEYASDFRLGRSYV